MPDHNLEPLERLIGERERRQLTNVSRPHCWRLERENRFPQRLYLGPHTVRWRLSEILEWIANLPTAASVLAPEKSAKAKVDGDCR